MGNFFEKFFSKFSSAPKIRAPQLQKCARCGKIIRRYDARLCGEMADARDLKSLGEDPYRFESGHKHQRFKLGLKRSENGSLAQVPLPFFGSPYAIAFRSVYVTGERNSDAIAPRYSRISPSPIGNRYSGRSRGLSHLRQVVPYRRSLFRRSAMNCLSPYASLFTSCVNCIRSLRSGRKRHRRKSRPFGENI